MSIGRVLWSSLLWEIGTQSHFCLLMISFREELLHCWLLSFSWKAKNFLFPVSCKRKEMDLKITFAINKSPDPGEGPKNLWISQKMMAVFSCIGLLWELTQWLSIQHLEQQLSHCRCYLLVSLFSARQNFLQNYYCLQTQTVECNKIRLNRKKCTMFFI